MNGRKTLVVAVAGTIALMLGLLFFWREGITEHTRGWQRATRLAMGERVPWLDRIYRAAISQEPEYWWEQAKYHETMLLKIGYLTNCEFHLTNQVITREFSSNFFRLIRQQLGTNTDQVWMCHDLTNRDGIAPTLPVKDIATWEQTFRECAARYASNLPPAMPTSSVR